MSDTGWMLVWLRLVGTLSRFNVATLLKSPGIGAPLGAWAGVRGGHRGVAEVVQRAHKMLRRLDRDVIGNSGCRIGPEIGVDLLRGAEAGIEVAGDRLRVETELQRPRAVDLRNEGRRI